MKPTAPLVDAAIFISLPAAPRKSEWKEVRGVVARRVVNAYCKTDYVLAGVGRLHEIMGGAISSMAGIARLEVDGIENIDLSEVVAGEAIMERQTEAVWGLIRSLFPSGHFELNDRMPQILKAVGISE